MQQLETECIQDQSGTLHLISVKDLAWLAHASRQPRVNSQLASHTRNGALLPQPCDGQSRHTPEAAEDAEVQRSGSNSSLTSTASYKQDARKHCKPFRAAHSGAAAAEAALRMHEHNDCWRQQGPCAQTTGMSGMTLGAGTQTLRSATVRPLTAGPRLQRLAPDTALPAQRYLIRSQSGRPASARKAQLQCRDGVTLRSAEWLLQARSHGLPAVVKEMATELESLRGDLVHHHEMAAFYQHEAASEQQSRDVRLVSAAVPNVGCCAQLLSDNCGVHVLLHACSQSCARYVLCRWLHASISSRCSS